MMRPLVFMLVCLVGCIACGDTQSTSYRDILTAHKWQYDVPTILQEIEQDKNLNTGQLQVLPSILNRLEGATFHFMEDGRLIFEAPKITKEGTWEVDAGTMTLMMDLGTTAPKQETIESITPDRLILKQDIDKGLLYRKNFIPAE